MSKTPRRRFLEQSAAAVSALTLTRCAPSGEPRAGSAVSAGAGLSAEALQALGDAVLPRQALGEEGVRRVLSDFRKWLDEFESVAELDHPYLSDEILYAPAHPEPRWGAQLQALELESQKRFDKAFTEISADERRRLLERHVGDQLTSRLPAPAEADHLTVGLLAYFYGTSEANDLCYQAAIERWTCRGLESASQKPGPPKEGA